LTRSVCVDSNTAVVWSSFQWKQPT